MANTFHKNERLYKRSEINLLFEKPLNYVCSPIKINYLKVDAKAAQPAKVMFIVPKKIFSKAHDRNKLKRRMREAYRLNKNVFYNHLINNEKHLLIACIYIGKNATTFHEIDVALKKALTKAVS
ncbi:MAG: ribonuclease P protein component [Bacteroidetes bacterium]|nr:ribonuclease P protein component [Bacteroidota bacterium]